MTPFEWISVCTLVMVPLGAFTAWVLRRESVVKRELQVWTRELFAERAHLVRLEERVAGLDRKLDRILDLLENR